LGETGGRAEEAHLGVRFGGETDWGLSGAVAMGREPGAKGDEPVSQSKKRNKWTNNMRSDVKTEMEKQAKRCDEHESPHYLVHERDLKKHTELVEALPWGKTCVQCNAEGGGQSKPKTGCLACGARLCSKCFVPFHFGTDPFDHERLMKGWSKRGLGFPGHPVAKAKRRRAGGAGSSPSGAVTGTVGAGEEKAKAASAVKPKEEPVAKKAKEAPKESAKESSKDSAKEKAAAKKPAGRR